MKVQISRKETYANAIGIISHFDLLMNERELKGEEKKTLQLPFLYYNEGLSLREKNLREINRSTSLTQKTRSPKYNANANPIIRKSLLPNSSHQNYPPFNKSIMDQDHVIGPPCRVSDYQL